MGDALLEAGALSVDVSDANVGNSQETPIYHEPGISERFEFGENRLVAIVELGKDPATILAEACRAASIGRVPKSFVTVLPEKDWLKLTRDQFSPLRISRRLWVIPSWHVPTDPEAINLFLDPGLAFGTGSHPTTRLCLNWLDEWMVPGRSVIDYGCGSGILAIAAAKLGAQPVNGVDIDMLAVQTSRDNARRNGVEAKFFHVDEVELAPADLLVANILSQPLKVLAPGLSSLVRAGGRILLTGILESQAQDVSQCYSRWFDMDAVIASEGWVMLSGARGPGK